jgi:hypothetical protein
LGKERVEKARRATRIGQQERTSGSCALEVRLWRTSASPDDMEEGAVDFKPLGLVSRKFHGVSPQLQQCARQHVRVLAREMSG